MLHTTSLLACSCRSPRRQRPLSTWSSSGLLGSMGSALKPVATLALPTPLPQQQCFSLRYANVSHDHYCALHKRAWSGLRYSIEQTCEQNAGSIWQPRLSARHVWTSFAHLLSSAGPHAGPAQSRQALQRLLTLSRHLSEAAAQTLPIRHASQAAPRQQSSQLAV